MDITQLKLSALFVILVGVGYWFFLINKLNINLFYFLAILAYILLKTRATKVWINKRKK